MEASENPRGQAHCHSVALANLSPALNKPRLIFDRFFGVNSDSLKRQRRELENSGSMLDLVLEHSKSVRGKLGKHDQSKFDEYLESVRSIEKRVERSHAWLDIPKPNVSPDGLFLDADENHTS